MPPPEATSAATLEQLAVPRIRVAAMIRRALTAGAMLAIWLALGVAVGLAAATSLLPQLTGHRALNVLSGSMEPTIGVGSVVIVSPIEPLEARVGDVLTFQDPADQSRLLTHRLESMRVDGGIAHVVTRGDANPTPERWKVSVSEPVGRVEYVAPKLGYARQWAAGNGGRILVAVVAVLWGVSALRDIWRGPRPAGAGNAVPRR